MSSLQYVPAWPLLATVLLFTRLATAVGVVSARRHGNPWRGALTLSRVLLVGAVLAVLAVTLLGGLAEGRGATSSPCVGSSDS